MLSFSRFSHTFEFDGVVALYHSLRMKPVYIKKSQYTDILRFLESSASPAETIPESLTLEIQNLIKYKILNTSEKKDEEVLDFVRSKIPKPSINVSYFILSEQCNLACKYCFLGNNSQKIRKKFSKENMTKKTADDALSFFIDQLQYAKNSDHNSEKATIIFYGGEPLLNFEVLEHTANNVRKLSEKYDVLKDCNLSVITNGILLDEKKLKKLSKLGVSIAISIDGGTKESNSQRVDILGNDTFHKVINVLDMAKKLNIDISLSITITEETIKQKQQVIELITSYNIKGLGFNILMSDNNFPVSDSYNEDAASFIIDVFGSLREKGVYEDRMMRKLKSFTQSKVYFSDCAATAGSQVVITPDGSVGICHGCIADRNFFIATIYDKFNANIHPSFLEWSQLTPVNKEACLDCKALGICGGGCPINALNAKKDNSIYSLDERFCVHAQKALNFLIKDLYRIISEAKNYEQ